MSGNSFVTCCAVVCVAVYGIYRCSENADEEMAQAAIAQADSVDAELTQLLEEEAADAQISTYSVGSNISFGCLPPNNDARVQIARYKMQKAQKYADQEVQMAKISSIPKVQKNHADAAGRYLDDAKSEASHIKDMGGVP